MLKYRNSEVIPLYSKGKDEGVDAFIGDIDKPDYIFQYKWYTKVTSSHWNEIVKSLKQAYRKKPKRWVLLLATDLTATYARKWQQLQKNYRQKKVKLELLSGSMLEALILVNKDYFIPRFHQLFPAVEVGLAVKEAFEAKDAPAKIKAGAQAKVTKKGKISTIFDRYNNKKLNLTDSEMQRVLSGKSKFVNLFKNVGLNPKMQKTNVKTVTKLGNCYYNVGQYDDAIFMFELILRQFPEDLRALNNKAAALKEKPNSANEALSLLGKALNISPRYVDAKVNKGAILLDSDNPTEAIKILEPLLPQARNDEVLLMNLVIAYSKLGKRNKTLHYYKLANKRIPNDVRMLNAVAMLYFRNKELVKALEYFDLAIKSSPESILPKVNKAAVLIEMDLNLLAMKLMDSVVKQYPDNSEALTNLAIAWHKIGKQDLAVVWGLRAFEKAPKDYVVVNNLGTCYFGVGDIEMALFYANKALEIKSDCLNALANQSVNLLLLQRHVEADACMTEYLKHDSKDLTILHNKKMVTSRLGLNNKQYSPTPSMINRLIARINSIYLAIAILEFRYAAMKLLSNWVNPYRYYFYSKGNP